MIGQLWPRVRGRYGTPRIHAELQAAGIRVGHNRVARLLRLAGVRGKTARRRQPRATRVDATQPVAANTLARQFRVSCPNTGWLAAITYIETGEGFLYLAAILDLASRSGQSVHQSVLLPAPQ
jgi:putative transposase